MTITVAIFNPAGMAYVLPGQHILDLMTEHLGQAQSLFISQKVVFYNIRRQPAAAEESEAGGFSEGDQQPADSQQDDAALQPVEAELVPDTIEMDETLRYVFPNRFRSEIITQANQRIHVFADNEAFTVIDGAAQLYPETRFDLYKDIMLFRSRPELVSRLAQLNVDVSLSSLARFEGQIAFVIGTEDTAEPVAQLWVDKETFRPLRWIITNSVAGYGAITLEIRYLDWWQIGDTFWYPMSIEFFQNDELVRSIQVQRYEVNPSVSPEIFNIQQLRTIYPTASPATSGSSASEAVSEVQQTIEEFRKMFE